MDHAQVAKDKKYAAWVLACLRREIETKKSPAPALGYYGQDSEVIVTFAPHAEEDEDFDPATL